MSAQVAFEVVPALYATVQVRAVDVRVVERAKASKQAKSIGFI